MSFFAGYLSQQFMLVGLTLPCWAVHFSTPYVTGTWGTLDTFATTMCLAGITLAHHADTSLHQFCTSGTKGLTGWSAILQTGLWKYSRHPNHFSEQMFWWGLGLYGVAAGQTWVLVGTIFNSVCLLEICRLVEERMLAKPARAAAYKAYMQRTRFWLPLPLGLPFVPSAHLSYIFWNIRRQVHMSASERSEEWLDGDTLGAAGAALSDEVVNSR